MSDHFRHPVPPDLRLRTKAFENRFRFVKWIMIGVIIFSLCSFVGSIYVVGHFVVKFW